MSDVKALGRLTWGLIGAAVILQVVIFTYAINASVDGQAKVDAINRFIYCTLERSKRTLPTIEYYREHPDELAVQLALAREQQAEFSPPPEPCSP